MPKHTGPRKQNGPRKRTGCVTCKTAHVKCTEEKPHCRRCIRLKLDCDYEFKLLWEEDSASRGTAHGRAGVWSKEGKSKAKGGKKSDRDLRDRDNRNAAGHAASPREWEFISLGIEDFIHGTPTTLNQEQDFDSDEEHSDICVFRTTGNFELAKITQQRPFTSFGDVFLDDLPDGLNVEHVIEEADEEFDMYSYDSQKQLDHTILCSNIPAFDLTSTETQLIEYYIHSLAPKCSLSTERNPYLDVLLPIAYDFAPLRHALLAASAFQLFHLSGERMFEVQSLKHRSKAIRGLNSHLGREKIDWKSLATMVMFCFRDISDGCEPSWITHLNMGLQMLRELKCGTRTDADLRKFCEIYFVAHEVMGRTAWEDQDRDVEIYEWDKAEEYQEIDAIMGCSRELISLISQITSLSADIQRHSGREEHIAKAGNILQQITSLQHFPWQWSTNPDSMMKIAEIKRLTAILHFHDRVLTRLPSFDALMGFSVSDLQDAIITQVRNLPTSSGASLWPLFVLGNSSLQNVEQAQFVLNRLIELENSRYLGNVYHARRRVERDIRTRLGGNLWGEPNQAGRNISEGISENERWVSLA